MKKTSRTDSVAGAALTLACALAALWLLTHDGCAHPLGNALALAVYIATGLALLLPRATAAWAKAGRRREPGGGRRPRVVVGHAGGRGDCDRADRFERSF